MVADVADTGVAVHAVLGADATPSGVVATNEQTSVPLAANSVPVAVSVGSVPPGMTVGLTLVTVGWPVTEKAPARVAPPKFGTFGPRLPTSTVPESVNVIESVPFTIVGLAVIVT